MVANPPQSISDPPTKVTYPVLLEAVAGGWIATIPGLATGRAIGETREIAIDRLQQMITQNLSLTESGELTQLEIALPSQTEHPSMKFAGMFQDDPYFEQVLEHMEAFRQADREEYLRQLDAEEATLPEKTA
jgi:predicted RNase H-like HicB family nuclease